MVLLLWIWPEIIQTLERRDKMDNSIYRTELVEQSLELLFGKIKFNGEMLDEINNSNPIMFLWRMKEFDRLSFESRQLLKMASVLNQVLRF